MKNENNGVVMTLSLIIGFILGALTGLGIAYLVKKNDEKNDFTAFDDIDCDDLFDDCDDYEDECNCYSF